MSATFTYTDTLTVSECPTCGVTHAYPQILDQRATDHPMSEPNTVWIYCPNGHRWAYTGKSTESKLREQLEREKAARIRADARTDQARAEADHERARANGYKGQMVKTKKRIGKGVCPCCNRHFANVERHMASQHPDFAGATNGDSDA